MTIDPRVGMYMSIALAVIGVLGGLSDQFTTVFGAHVTAIILAVAYMLMTVGNAVNGVLHAIPSKSTPQALAQFPLGPSSPPASNGSNHAPPAAKGAAMLLLAVMLGALAFPPSAIAAERQPERLAAARPHITGNPVKDIQNDISDLQKGGIVGDTKVTSALAKPFQDLAAFLSSDATAAAALATQIPELQDGNGQQCWLKMQTAGKVFQAHPVPLTFKAMTDVEALRLLAMTANNLCADVHCTQVFADLTSMAQAASPVALPVPGLHDLCSKIPQISQVAPVAVNVSPAAPPTVPATPAAPQAPAAPAAPVTPQ